MAEVKKMETEFNDVIQQKFLMEMKTRIKSDKIFNILTQDNGVLNKVIQYSKNTFKKYKDMIVKYPSVNCVDIDTYIKIQFEDHDIIAKLLKVLHDRYSKELVDSIQTQMSANNVKLTATDDNPFGDIPTQFAPIMLPPSNMLPLSDEPRLHPYQMPNGPKPNLKLGMTTEPRPEDEPMMMPDEPMSMQPPPGRPISQQQVSASQKSNPSGTKKSITAESPFGTRA